MPRQLAATASGRALWCSTSPRTLGCLASAAADPPRRTAGGANRSPRALWCPLSRPGCLAARLSPAPPSRGSSCLPRRLPLPDLRRARGSHHARPAFPAAGLERWVRRTRTPSIGSPPSLPAGPGRTRSLFASSMLPSHPLSRGFLSRLRPRREPSTTLSRFADHEPRGSRPTLPERCVSPTSARPNFLSRALARTARCPPCLRRRRKPRLTALLPLRPVFSAALSLLALERSPVARGPLQGGAWSGSRTAWTNRLFPEPQAALHRPGVVGRSGGVKRPPLTPTCRALRTEGDPSAGRTHPRGRFDPSAIHRRGPSPRQRGPARLGAGRLPPASAPPRLLAQANRRSVRPEPEASTAQVSGSSAPSPPAPEGTGG